MAVDHDKLDSATVAEARRRLTKAEQKLAQRRPLVQLREAYVRGEQTLPFAPAGVNVEYQELQRMSIANWLDLWTSAPVQRLRMDGIRTEMGPKAKAGETSEVDRRIWRNVFQANKWDVRQSTVYASLMKHGRGIVSVWPNARNKARPIVRPEAFENVHIEPLEGDPTEAAWAVKIYTVEETVDNGFILPDGVTRTRTVGIVYDETRMIRFERGGFGAATWLGGDWEYRKHGAHGMRAVPFATFDYKLRDDGTPWSGLDHMMPQQDALNTIRFNTLLAMQFSAFRQRIVTGFDPRVTDREGNFVYRTDSTGKPMLDADGRPIHVLNSPGKVGVDRMLAFAGIDTKVFDLPESNLKNYIEVHENFLINMFASGQIPPQYLLSRMANLSGDALAGAESTFVSLLQELQLAAGEGNEQIASLAWAAMGETEEFDPGAECVWADAEARSFAQIIDAITKLVSVGFPRRGAFEMIPGATTQRVDKWLEEAEDESLDAGLARITRGLDAQLMS